MDCLRCGREAGARRPAESRAPGRGGGRGWGAPMWLWSCGGSRPPSGLLSALLSGELALDFGGGSGATGSRRYSFRSSWTHCLWRAENLEAVVGEGFGLSVPVGDGALKITL